MRAIHALFFAAASVATAAATGNQQQTLCHDVMPEPTTPVPPTCSKVSVGIAFGSDDGDNLINPSPRDLASCCATCAATRGCHAFVHYDPIHMRNQCFLITSSITRTDAQADSMSGYVDTPKPCLFEPVGTKLVGNVYDQALAGNADACCGRCGFSDRCVAYNFDSSRGRCEYLDSVSDKTTSAGWISGKNQ